MELRRTRPLGRGLGCLAVLVLSVTSAGCGGGEENGSGSGAKRRFIEQADARCKATSERTQGLLGLAAVDQAEAVIQSLPALEAMVADLRALPAPPDDPELQAVMADFDRALTQFRAVDKARKARDEVTVQRTLNQLRIESPEFQVRAERYGFKECGQRS